jgi:transcriptional regulator with XRE-family HTH domain
VRNQTEEDPVFSEVSRCFVEAVRRSMRVAGQDDEGMPDALTQTELAERAGMGRTTLNKYLGSNSEGTNPDLKIICQLALAVGVPPAMLLMRPQDWASVGTGMLTFLDAMADPKFRELASELQSLDSTTSQRIAEASLRIGQLIKTVEDAHDPRISQEVREFRHASKVSIATTAASIPFHLGGVATSHLPALLVICSILGTTTARANQ